jgi:hypothetical protein
MTRRVKRGDTRTRVGVLRENGKSVNLSTPGEVLTMFLRSKAGGASKSIVCAIDDVSQATRGRFHFDPPDDFFDPAGVYRSEFERVTATGEVFTYPSGADDDFLDWVVVQDLG